MGRPDFSTPGTAGSGQTVAVSNRPEVNFVDLSVSGTLAAGASEKVELYAPVGSTYEPQAMQIEVPPSNGSSGDIGYIVNQPGAIGVFEVRSNPGDSASWFMGEPVGSKFTKPQTAALQANSFGHLVATENQPVEVVLFNNSDSGISSDRLVKFVVKEESY